MDRMAHRKMSTGSTREASEVVTMWLRTMKQQNSFEGLTTHWSTEASSREPPSLLQLQAAQSPGKKQISGHVHPVQALASGSSKPDREDLGLVTILLWFDRI